MPSKHRDATDDTPRDAAHRALAEDTDRIHKRLTKSASGKSEKHGSEARSPASTKKRHHQTSRNEDQHCTTRPSTTTSDEKAASIPNPADARRISLPYPSFSKAHSREAVLSREDVSDKKASDPPTPEPTDCGDAERQGRSNELPRASSASSKKPCRPPTPPETEVSAGRRRGNKPNPKHTSSKEATVKSPGKSRPSSHRVEEASNVSRKSAAGSSSQATCIKSPKQKSRSTLWSSLGKRSESTRQSSRTSKQHQPKSAGASSSPCLKGPLNEQTYVGAQSPRSNDSAPAPFSHDEEMLEEAESRSKTATPASASRDSPTPLPPPPPAVDIQELPRIDYLLQHGGLPYPVPRQFLSVLPLHNGGRASKTPLIGAETLFAPFFNLIEEYGSVLSRQGSIAVATGHRSVARRLLDRLENVFSRDLPLHGCSCVICDQSPQEHEGLTWGDVLEWVSGRIELPGWPPFDLAAIGTKAAELSAEAPQRPASPLQLDPDVADEFREHYLRQSKKVRSAVDKWLNKTGETPVPPPQDVDDETLAFAVLTNMEPEHRPFFDALLSGPRELRPQTRAPSPAPGPRSEFLVKCGLSLQRLYRLQQVPRDAESAAYLVRNQHTHDLLVTVSNINNAEWEILTSGRFDGFLWSGADAADNDLTPGPASRSDTPANGYFTNMQADGSGSRVPSSMGSRNATPFSPGSRGDTPASFASFGSNLPGGRLPVSSDEEMEMAAAAEIEREIYVGMEILEDAFEKLHQKAERVRTALRQRGAGMMQNFQSRRRIDVLPTHGGGASSQAAHERPAWVMRGDADVGSEDDWDWEEGDMIMPDDSASNISSSRHRRPKRRTERRTPAPIEEEEEEGR